jgi:hypothetical protein
MHRAVIATRRLRKSWQKRQVSKEEKIIKVSPLDRLPDETIVHILSYLPSSQLLGSVAWVNKRFNRDGIHQIINKMLSGVK